MIKVSFNLKGWWNERYLIPIEYLVSFTIFCDRIRYFLHKETVGKPTGSFMYESIEFSDAFSRYKIK